MSQPIQSHPRIVFAALETYSLVGGLQNFNRRVIANLVARTIDRGSPDPRVVLLRDGDSIPQEVSNIAASYSNRVTYFARSLSAAWDADLFVIGHVNLLPLAALVRLLRWKLPILLFVHGDEVWNDPGQRRKRWYEPYLISALTKIASVSNFTANIMSREFNVAPAKFSLLPNAVDPIDFFPKRNFGSPIILTVTRLNPRDREKNVGPMIEAVADLKSRIPDVRYEIIGSGTLVAELKKKAAKHGVADIVEFRGRVSEDELSEAYGRATLFALPSSKEGFGIVYLEAWLRGLPVICSCFGASQEIVSNGEDGFVVDHRDPIAVAERLFQLLSNPGLAQQLGQNGRKKVEQKYLNRSFRENLDRLLDEMLSEQR